MDAIADEDCQQLFDKLVHPLMRLVRAVAGPMKRSLRSTERLLRAVDLELAKFNVKVNAIAQKYARNDTYYPDDLIENDTLKKHLQQMEPSKRVAEPRKTAELALYLAGPYCTQMVGRILPFAGGWTTTTG